MKQEGGTMGELVEDGHLGGFAKGGDKNTFSPKLWDALIKDYKVKSVIDVGCGEGHSAKYFQDKGLEVLAIDGSTKVLESAVFKPIVIHDFTKGIYIMDSYRKYDLVWCCEVLEYIDEKYLENVLDLFRDAKTLAITHALPGQGGYHHTNEKEDSYWIEKICKEGFKFKFEKSMKYRELGDGWYFKQSGMIFEQL